jgi:hypothetical protein
MDPPCRTTTKAFPKVVRNHSFAKPINSPLPALAGLGVQIRLTDRARGVRHEENWGESTEPVASVKSIENATTLLYSVDSDILLSAKELPKTRQFESLLRHHSFSSQQLTALVSSLVS